MSGVQEIIHFKNVSKSYGDKVVLDDVSLKINKGEFVTLLGTSGCGKTTFLKLINALITPDKGTVFVFEKDLSTINKINLRREIGYVIQSIGLFPHMTVKQNINYVPSLFKHQRSDLYPMDKLLKLVSLEEELLDRYPDELSGGQKQRTGIARALITIPSIMLMDEPFGAVDEITRKQLQKSIKEIQQELGITILFVTHSVEEALYLGTKVAVFENHGIVQYDTPEQIVKAPADSFVAELIRSARLSDY